MNVHRVNPFDPDKGAATPEGAPLQRRQWLRRVGYVAGAAALGGGAVYGGWRWYRGGDDEVIQRGRVALTPSAAGPPGDRFYPMPRDDRFAYGRTETVESDAARFTNFFEFTSLKDAWRHVGAFQPDPWTITVDGMCRNPFKVSVAELLTQQAKARCERLYRHRCVERWAMAIPWSGIPLAALVAAADPVAQATHVRFVSFNRPSQASAQASPEYSWPYVEGLTIAEATNELAFLATGMYGHPLLKQHGAPIRLVVPWKYGYKSIKSIERIEFVERKPRTFWEDLMPQAYPFEANVEPDVPLPWDQREEWMLGTKEVFKSQLYNGYGEWVAGLYKT
jgi:methionine sulfoxide reductase catalytic subunit